MVIYIHHVQPRSNRHVCVCMLQISTFPCLPFSQHLIYMQIMPPANYTVGSRHSSPYSFLQWRCWGSRDFSLPWIHASPQSLFRKSYIENWRCSSRIGHLPSAHGALLLSWAQRKKKNVQITVDKEWRNDSTLPAKRKELNANCFHSVTVENSVSELHITHCFLFQVDPQQWNIEIWIHFLLPFGIIMITVWWHDYINIYKV